MSSINFEVLRNVYNQKFDDLLIRAYLGNFDNTIGLCNVKIQDKQVAKICRIEIFKDDNKRKSFGTELWKFSEDYLIKKYKIRRFFGELDFNNTLAALFWEKNKFQIIKGTEKSSIIKEVNSKRT